jgi:hypothetical protein
VTDHPQLPSAQLLVYGFGPNADFEGRLVGALERIESGGALRVLEALFVASDPETGELVAADLVGDSGGIVGPLLSFRLEPSARRRATERALDPDRAGVPADVLRDLAKTLEPGAAMVAVLVEHKWAGALEDAVSRTGGTLLTNAFVDTTALTELTSDLVAAAKRRAEADEGRSV